MPVREGLGDVFYSEPLVGFEDPLAKRRLKGLIDISGLSEKVKVLEFSPAGAEEILRVHTSRYFDFVKKSSELGYGIAGDSTGIGQGTFMAALRSAGACVAAAAAVYDRQVDNAYVLNHPPGHHATRDEGGGYCVFSNIPIAIEDLRFRRALKRVAVVDWDVHHGNGTESIYYEDPDTLTVSLHQDQLYPTHSGSISHNGNGKGLGACLNIPLPAGSGHSAYITAMTRVVVPALERFRPEIIVVACGFDASAMDPLGMQMLSSDSFREMTSILMSAASRICQGKLIVCQEGGYSDAYVPWCGLAVVEQLAGWQTGAKDPYLNWISSIGGQQIRSDQFEVIERAEELVARIP